MGQGTGSTQGETIGPDQEPTQAGDRIRQSATHDRMDR